MAENKNTENAENTDSKDTNVGTPDPAATDTADTATARAAGISEGDVKALRDDAGLNQLPGHEANVHAWENSPAGKAWLKGEKDREKAAKNEAKQYEEQVNDDGLSEADAKYREVVSKG